jgi:hypothetical protein
MAGNPTRKDGIDDFGPMKLRHYPGLPFLIDFLVFGVDNKSKKLNGFGDEVRH